MSNFHAQCDILYSKNTENKRNDYTKQSIQLKDILNNCRYYIKTISNRIITVTVINKKSNIAEAAAVAVVVVVVVITLLFLIVSVTAANAHLYYQWEDRSIPTNVGLKCFTHPENFIHSPEGTSLRLRTMRIM
jgi:hypothetical protein